MHLHIPLYHRYYYSNGFRKVLKTHVKKRRVYILHVLHVWLCLYKSGVQLWFFSNFEQTVIYWFNRLIRRFGPDFWWFCQNFPMLLHWFDMHIVPLCTYVDQSTAIWNWSNIVVVIFSLFRFYEILSYKISMIHQTVSLWSLNNILR